MLSKPITIDRVNLGGISDSKYSGAKYSVAKLVGWDLHQEVGLLKVRQKLAKDSAAVVTEFCKVALEASNGDIYWFSSTSGKIWKTGSPYTLAYTTTPETGDAGCLGAFEYSGYIYWCTEDRGHRIPVNATALADWATYAEEDELPLNLDQVLGSTGQTYTTPAAINEGATHRQSFAPSSSPISGIGVNIGAVGTGDWTLTIHNSADVSQGAKTITNGSLAAGFNIFEFASVLDLTKGTTYHIHITSTVADGTVVSTTSADLEDGNVKIYRTSDDEFHPMIEHFGVLYIGDRHFIHQVEVSSTGSHSFTTEALDIKEPLRVKCLGKAPLDLLLGTIITSTVARTQIIKWNTYSESFTSSDEIPEVGINAFIPADNYIFVHAGLGGSIYIYDGEKLQLFKKIQGDYTPTATAMVHPNAVGMLGGLSLFGLSNGTGNPADQGVYALGHYSRDYPFVYDLSFPISERSGADLVVSGIEIGAIVVSGFNLYVSWKSASTTGAVDKLDYSNKLEKAYFETMVIIPERSQLQNFAKFVLGYQNRPASTSFTAKYKINHATSYAAFDNLVEDTDRKTYVADEVLEASTLQIRVEANVSSNSAPDFESCALYLSQ